MSNESLDRLRLRASFLVFLWKKNKIKNKISLLGNDRNLSTDDWQWLAPVFRSIYDAVAGDDDDDDGSPLTSER
ncbi:hypothetical protein QR98_0091270 [Sarcoptes scabiei]|uniref:Uncharacterized protein n=1 Tax=Sarcoptes scabiei TaxID=52283 RepID=A0A132AID3_SARSC|nr:hypothetical protein QR98_0091270 [Sarcoptes scabiei]